MLADVVHFGLEADQHVAQTALDEGGGRAAAAGIEHQHVLQETGHEGASLGRIIAVGLAGGAPGGQIGITAVAGGFRVREHQFHVVTHQIVPGVDALRVVLAHQKRHGGIERRAVVRQARLPVRRDQLPAIVQDLYVGDLVVSHHVGTQALQDRQRLLRRAGVRLFDGQLVVRMLLIPLLFKAGIQRDEQFTGNVIRAVQQFRRRRGAARQQRSRQPTFQHEIFNPVLFHSAPYH